VQLPGVFRGPVLEGHPGRRGDGGDGVQYGPVGHHQRLVQVGLEPRVGVDRMHLAGQLGDDPAQLLGVEDADRLAERAQAEAPDPQLLADLLQSAGLLKGADRVDQRVGQAQEHQGDVLVEVETAIARRVAFAADPVQRGQERQQVPQAFDAADPLGVDLRRRP
jgi:hypothetical protein